MHMMIRKVVQKIGQLTSPLLAPQQVRRHYRSRNCVLCLGTVINNRHHVLDIHVKKNPNIPRACAETAIQMPIHGSKA